MNKGQKRLGQILVDRGLLTAEQLEAALAEQKKTGRFIGEIAAKKYNISESGMARAIAEQFGIPYISLRNRYIDWNMIRRLSPALVFDYRCVPVSLDSKTATIAVENPLDILKLEKIEEKITQFGVKMKIALAAPSDIEDAIERYKKYIKTDMRKLFEE